MHRRIDLNCDMGEGYGPYSMGNDELLMGLISSANIACGYHAGDPLVMDRTVRLAARHGVGIGAHPGFPDLLGFGRRPMQLSPDEIENYVLYQVGALAGFARSAGSELVHVKPHGALYNMAAREIELARAIARGVARAGPDLILVGLPGSALVQAAQEVGLRAAREGFADRAYNPDGTLRARRLPGTVIHEPQAAAEQAVRMARDGIVVAHSGEELPLQVDTLCIHGDTPTAVEIVEAIRQRLEGAGIEVTPMGGFWEAMSEPRILPASDAALVVEFGDTIDPRINRRVHTLAHALGKNPPLGLGEAVPTYRSLLVHYDPLQLACAEVQAFIAGALRTCGESPPQQPRLVEIPTAYGGEFGPDIAFVAEHNGLSVEDVIRLHSAAVYTVYMLGFTPGFPYLGGLPEAIATPRLATPRKSVPAGSVGIAGFQTGIYPLATPGGWQLIGRTPVALFDPYRSPAALLKPGDRVRFVPISAEEFAARCVLEGAGSGAPCP